MNPKKKKIMITAIVLSVLFILGAARYMTVHHSKFCLSKHSYTEPLDNAKKAAQESGKPVLMPQIGEVVYLE
jgi:flagellar basal body-associated protein FliL